MQQRYKNEGFIVKKKQKSLSVSQFCCLHRLAYVTAIIKVQNLIRMLLLLISERCSLVHQYLNGF